MADQGQGAAPLRQALAIAVVQRRRQSAEVQKWKQRVEECEEDIKRLRQEDPLQLLARLGAAPQLMDAAEHTCDYSSVPLWQRAFNSLEAEQRRFLGTLQRYLLSKELKEQPAANPLPSVLSRTPLQATLEVMSDVLEAHMEQTAAAPAPAVPGVAIAGANGTQLTSAHGRILQQAASCLAALVGHAGLLMNEDDGLCLAGFFPYVLEMTCLPEASQQPGTIALGTSLQQQGPAQLSQESPAPGAHAAMDLAQSTPAVAREVIRELCSCPSTGLAVLGAAATAVKQYMQRLVAEVTGEHPSFMTGRGASGNQGQQVEADTGLDEEALGQAVVQLAGVLQSALQSLAAWAAEVGGCDGAYMSSMATAIMAAKDACKLIAVTHGGIARQMQRVAAQLVNALSQMAAMGDG